MARSPLFIIGYPRSGTTLARALLGAHACIELANEPELMRGLMSAGVDPAGTVAVEDRTGVLLEIGRVGMSRRHLKRLPAEQIVRFLQEPAALSVPEIYDMLLPRPQGDLVWGDKSLGNTLFIPELDSLYPDSVFVYLIRDPRAAMVSRYRKTFNHPAHEPIACTPEAIRFVAIKALGWSLSVAMAEEAEAEVGPERLHRLGFERLVADPQRELTTVCELLGLGYEGAMLDPVRRRHDVVLDEQASVHAMVTRAVDPSRAAAASELTPWATHVVQRYGGAAMERHGYRRSTASVPVADMSRVAAVLESIEPSLGAKLERASARRGQAPARVRPAIERIMAELASTRTEIDSIPPVGDGMADVPAPSAGRVAEAPGSGSAHPAPGETPARPTGSPGRL